MIAQSNCVTVMKADASGSRAQGGATFIEILCVQGTISLVVMV
jgi:hypothetical protein